MATDVKNRKNSLEGIGKTGKPGCIRRKTPGFTSENKTQYSFLTTKFSNKSSMELPGCCAPFGQFHKDGKVYWRHEGTGIEIDAKENINFLAEAVKSYCQIHSHEFRFKSSRNPLKDLSVLFNIALSAKPNQIELALDYADPMKKVVIIEYQMCDFFYDTLFFLPVKFVEKVPEQIQGIIKEAVAFLVEKFEFPDPEDQMDFQYALGMWDDELDYHESRYETQEEYHDFLNLIESYREGPIRKLLIRCMHTSGKYKVNELIEELKRVSLQYKGSKIEDIIELICEGLKLEDICWESYKISPEYCTIEDFDVHDESTFMDMERLFAVTYDNYDDVTVCVEDTLNNEGGCLEIIGFYDSRILTPAVKDKFEATKKLIVFAEWFGKLVNKIEEYDGEK